MPLTVEPWKLRERMAEESLMSELMTRSSSLSSKLRMRV